MDKFMRAWIIGCMLLFGLRQFMPNVAHMFDVLGLLGMAFALIISVWIVTGVYEHIKESLQKPSEQRQS